MNKKNQHKFNKSSGTGKQPFRNFPIKQFRVDTNHPITSSKDSCSSRMGSMWSQQEELMVKGLSNILQCEAREAIRIALYEACKTNQDTLAKYLVFAEATSKRQGHTSRDRKGSVALPKSEKDNALALAKAIKCSEIEVLRLAVIWLSKGIRDESITRLTDCKRINQLTLRNEWTKENPEKANQPSTIKPLIDAQAKGREEAENIRESKARREEELYKETQEYLLGNPGLNWESAQKLIELEKEELEHDRFEQIVKEQIGKEKLDEKEYEIWNLVRIGLTHEEAVAAIEWELAEEEPPLTEEEEETLMKELEIMRKELWGDTPPRAEPIQVPAKKSRRKTPEWTSKASKKQIQFLEEQLAKFNYYQDQGLDYDKNMHESYKNLLSQAKEQDIIQTYFNDIYPNP